MFASVQKTDKFWIQGQIFEFIKIYFTFNYKMEYFFEDLHRLVDCRYTLQCTKTEVGDVPVFLEVKHSSVAIPQSCSLTFKILARKSYKLPVIGMNNENRSWEYYCKMQLATEQ